MFFTFHLQKCLMNHPSFHHPPHIAVRTRASTYSIDRMRGCSETLYRSTPAIRLSPDSISDIAHTIETLYPKGTSAR